MKCIDGSVDVQRLNNKWRRRKLWINHAPESEIFSIYIRSDGNEYWLLRSDGTTRYHGKYWRHIKLSERYELFDNDKVLRVRDIVAATRYRLGVI